MTLEQVNEALMNERTIVHTHLGIKAEYHIRGVITRYTKEKGWTYSLELQDFKSGCLVYAALSDCEVRV